MKISGNKLKTAREAAGVTRADVAKAAGVSHVRIWQVETDGVSNMNEHVVNAICVAVGLKKTSDLEAD